MKRSVLLFLDSEEALGYRIIDKVIKRRIKAKKRQNAAFVCFMSYEDALINLSISIEVILSLQ
jgi:hypothetical protein